VTTAPAKTTRLAESVLMRTRGRRAVVVTPQIDARLDDDR
jgi:hypothetical protein